MIFSFVTGFTRAQLYRYVTENTLERHVVAFATDSICLTKKLCTNSDNLGKFSFKEGARDVFFLQNGIYRFNGKWKQRGLGKLGSKEIEHLDTIGRDGKLYYKFKIQRVGKLRSSIIQNKIADIGKFKTVEREINLNADRKRFWPERLESIDSKVMNNSRPISMNYFAKDRI